MSGEGPMLRPTTWPAKLTTFRADLQSPSIFIDEVEGGFCKKNSQCNLILVIGNACEKRVPD